MIFNTDSSSFAAVKESPYELGMEGAIMHVYENECNWNAMMKAVGISELRYYQETGRDLFVHEAGAFSAFKEKAKAFFKKVIEKIKSIFQKFKAAIDKYFVSDQEFLKRYRAEVNKRVPKDFKFKGYQYKDLDTFISGLGNKFPKDTQLTTALGAAQNANAKQYLNSSENTEDEKEAEIEKIYGEIVDESSLSESEFREKVNEKCYGDKEEFDVDIQEQFGYISNAKNAIKTAENSQKKLTDSIGKIITALEKLPDRIDKATPKDAGADVYDTNAKNQKGIEYTLSLWKARSSAATIAYGTAVGALKHRNRQAKAICVKALSYSKYNKKNESFIDDIFAGVAIV